MSSIKDETTVQVSAARAYEALTRQADYRGWWNKVAEVPEAVGGDVKLRFLKEGDVVNMGFRVDELTPGESVRWTCTSHDMPSWVGTTLSWRIRNTDGGVVVSLDHGGWKDAGPGPVAEGWRHFLGSLRAYLETGTGQPW